MFTILGVQGKVSTKAAAPSCSVCNNGNYQNDTGQFMCDTCVAGRYKKEQVFEGNPSFLYLCVSDDVLSLFLFLSSSSHSLCLFFPSSFLPFFLFDQKQCSPGFYQNEEQQASCLPCIPGTYANEEGASSSCKICLANQYRGNTMEATICVSCPQGWTSTNGSAKCTVCGAGEYGDVVGGGCKTCAAGSFRTSIDTPTECKLCLAGMYQDQAQQASCLPCVSDEAGMCVPFLLFVFFFSF